MYPKDSIILISNNAHSFDYKFSIIEPKWIEKFFLIVIYPNGAENIFESNGNQYNRYNSDKDGYVDDYFEVNLSQVGEYKLTLKIDWWEGGMLYIRKRTVYIYVNPEESQELKPYTLGDTIRRLLALTPTRTKNEQPKYTFDPVQLAEFDKEESPEFAFTGHTLFEALLIIAQYKGAFPVLDENGVISFRKLWSGERRTEEDLPPPIDEVSCSDINQYCTYLDTEVQNLVGVNNSQTGSIVEPYAGGYKTTRAASGSEISQDTAVISTDYNQYLHIKEEIGYLGKVLSPKSDITPYVYESGNYNALSDTSGAYPNSKAYALKWKQMSKNITELAHRTKGSNSISQAFKEPAMANIVNIQTGVSYDTGFVKWIKDLIDPVDSSPSFADLMFRTTYIPVINSRIKQYKDYFGAFHHNGSIKYNQIAELVDSELYGEHLKQLIRKIGNATIQKIYIFENMDDVPKVGTLVNGYSVYAVKMSIRENEVIATISYVKYAELSQYIGVKNPWKDSDVSLDKCYDRQISINEFLLFTHDKTKKITSDIFPNNTAALSHLLPSGSAPGVFALTCVEATGYMAAGDKLNTVFLPVISLAVGNSIMFQWKYRNNYSAGYMSEEAPDGATSLISNTKFNRAQKAVKYTDMYGKMETYNFSLLTTGPVPYLNYDKTECIDMLWVEDGNEIKAADEVVRKIAHSLPLKPVELKEARLANDGSYIEWTGTPVLCLEDLVVEKNSSEALTFTLQLHYCADEENFIVGSGITNYCPLIGGMDYSYCEKIVLFKERINIFDRRISLKKGRVILERHPQSSLFKQEHKSGLKISIPTTVNETDADGNYKYNSWAYVVGKNPINDTDGLFQIVFGENRDLNGSDFKTELYLLPMHKLEDFI